MSAVDFLLVSVFLRVTLGVLDMLIPDALEDILDRLEGLV